MEKKIGKEGRGEYTFIAYDEEEENQRVSK